MTCPCSKYPCPEGPGHILFLKTYQFAVDPSGVEKQLTHNAVQGFVFR